MAILSRQESEQVHFSECQTILVRVTVTHGPGKTVTYQVLLSVQLLKKNGFKKKSSRKTYLVCTRNDGSHLKRIQQKVIKVSQPYFSFQRKRKATYRQLVLILLLCGRIIHLLLYSWEDAVDSISSHCLRTTSFHQGQELQYDVFVRRFTSCTAFKSFESSKVTLRQRKKTFIVHERGVTQVLSDKNGEMRSWTESLKGIVKNISSKVV